MKKLLVTTFLFFACLNLYAEGTEEYSIGITVDAYFKPALDTSIQGVRFLDYKYFFNDFIGVGASLEMTTLYSDSQDRKFVQIPIQPSVTIRLGNENLKVPFVTRFGPIMSITSGDFAAGFKTSFQTGIEYFVTKNIGIHVLMGPFYSYISGNMFGLKMDSGITVRL